MPMMTPDQIAADKERIAALPPLDAYNVTLVRTMWDDEWIIFGPDEEGAEVRVTIHRAPTVVVPRDVWSQLGSPNAITVTVRADR